MSGTRVLSIGTATQDVFLMGGDAFKAKKEGGVEYEHLPLGQKIIIDEAVFTTGGNAMNASITFARQGMESGFVGFVGEDPAGQTIMNVLDVEGVSTTCARQEDNFRTSYSTILLAPSGERTILRYYGSVTKLHEDDYNLDCIEKADWLYLSSVGSMGLLEKIITKAAKLGVKVAFNPGTKELEHPQKIRSLFEDIHILITNKEEMQKLVEGGSREELVRHAAALVPVVVVSDGPNGVVATDGKKIITAGMYDDVAVVDRTGAGDAFGSGFTAWFAMGKSLEECVTFASANSTSVVSKIGATPGILYKHDDIHDMPLTVKDL